MNLHAHAHAHVSSRRDFLQVAGLAGASLAFGTIPGATLAAAEGSPATGRAPSWVERPMRWAQLTLVEDDPGRFDPRFWLDYFKRTKSDAVCLSAGGCVAYYPTTVPFHHRSQWLGDRDPFGELVAGCRKLGMVVIARTDPHATYNDAAEAHPDWIAVGADGRPRRHWASPEMWVTCALGPYNFEFMTEVKREIMTRYRVDGIFINRWEGSGMCYCQHCRTNFQKSSGHELPRTNDARDPVRRAYVLWHQQRLFELWQRWDSEVRKIHPDSCVIPNTGGGATSALDMDKIGELAPTLMADRQARHGLAAPWANGKNGKEYRATMGRKPIVGIFSVGVEEPYRWKDSVQNEAEIRLWVADGVANGLRPWFTKFGGVPHDPRWLKPVEELYRRYAAWEPYLRNEEPLARVGLVYSQQTAWFVGNAVEDHTLGWYQALIESRIPFEMVHDRRLSGAQLRPFKTLILPNITALSQDQCRQLSDFVAAGGSLIATHETSLRDEWGERRTNFGLAELFGVDYSGRTEARMQNAYLRLEHDAARHHPLLRGLEQAPRIIHGVARVDVVPRVKFPPAPLTLIPSYPDLPMEKVYPRVAKTDIAQVFCREVGHGRVLYFPWDIDRTFWEVLSTDHGRQKRSLTIHLVNLTNPMMMKGPIRELIPTGPQRVEIRLPEGTKARRVRLLAADASPKIQRAGAVLKVTVPSVLDHEIVAIDL